MRRTFGTLGEPTAKNIGNVAPRSLLVAMTHKRIRLIPTGSPNLLLLPLLLVVVVVGCILTLHINT